MGLHWSEKEALRAQYPEFWVDLLFEVLELVDAVESRRLTGYEATVKARARFSNLIEEHDPATRARVKAHQAKIAAEQRERNAEAARYEERRQAAIRGETLRIEKAATDETRERYEAAMAAEKRLNEETAERIARDEREKAKKDEEVRTAEQRRVEEADRLLQAIEKG